MVCAMYCICLNPFLLVVFLFDFLIKVSLATNFGMNSLTCVITGHCTNVPRNVNLEKLQNNYLFPEVIFIISYSYIFQLGFRSSLLTNLTF